MTPTPESVVQTPESARIVIRDGLFLAAGTPVWINGANTPWKAWNDFGGSFDAGWWDGHFGEMRANGMNATRVWISCDGEVGIEIDDAGRVSGATDKHWADLDTYFELARKHRIYVKATLLSFDHFKASHPHFQRWRNLMGSQALVDAYVSNYVIPFVKRYKNNPYLWAIDLMNEPEWASNTESEGSLPWEALELYFARAAVAIHGNSPILVTVGMGVIKYNSDAHGTNHVSDAVLRARQDHPDARLDFWSPHWYAWMDPWWPNPFYTSPAAFGLDPSKPAVLGESSAKGTTGHTLTSDYEAAHGNGWLGAMAWTSNGVDSNGGMSEVGPATRAFAGKHPELVAPR